jgi:large subunit ribosomal protein L13
VSKVITGIRKQKEVQKSWLLIDAKDAVLGRLASTIAKILKGKHKPGYVPYLDCGDNVIVINADKVHLTGNKTHPKLGKVYYHHTGYPGGIKEDSAASILSGRYPERVLEMAILRMLKKTPQRNSLMSNLRLYSGEKHPHEGQCPVTYDFASLNAKNLKRSNA